MSSLRSTACAGQLGKQLEAKFGLREGVDPQLYALGLKELWDIDPARHQLGLVVHTAGWPLDAGTYGVCVTCGQPIAPERLEAMPAAAHCIDCQRELSRAR